MKRLTAVAITLVILGLTALSGGHEPSTFGLMTPLLPVSVITGHSGLLTLGLTGAALLKLKAAGAITYWLSIRKHKRAHKGHGWGWKERKRHRRGVVKETRNIMVPGPETGPELDVGQFDPSLDEVLQYDQLGCGMRLVCELSATPDTTLKDDEKLILELFGRDGKVQNGEKASRGKLSYSYAALLGSHSEDRNTCSNVYGRCPYSAAEIMYSIRDVGGS